MRNLLYVSYYTINTPYEQEIQNLKASFDRWGLKYYIRGYQPRGSWLANEQIKSEFILHCMEKFRDFDIIWIDGDATIDKEPVLFQKIADETDKIFAVHWLNGQWLLAGTIYLRNTEQGRNFVRNWVHMQSCMLEDIDQVVLEKLAYKHEDIMYKLPWEYTKVFDKEGDAVIKHGQASRRTGVAVADHNLDAFKGLRPSFDERGYLRFVRMTPTALRILKRDYVSIGDGRWAKKHRNDFTLDSIVRNNPIAYVFGKGPSIDNLHGLILPDNAICICINDSVHTIRKYPQIAKFPRFVIQQDEGLADSCYDPESYHCVSYNARHHYSMHKDVFVFNPADYGCLDSTITVVLAIKIFKPLVQSFVFVGFDSCTTGVLDYAKSIGYESTKAGDPKRFFGHLLLICEALGEEPVFVR